MAFYTHRFRLRRAKVGAGYGFPIFRWCFLRFRRTVVVGLTALQNSPDREEGTRLRKTCYPLDYWAGWAPVRIGHSVSVPSLFATSIKTLLHELTEQDMATKWSIT